MKYLKTKKFSAGGKTTAMETRDHSQLLSVTEVNGANPKSQMSRGNLLKMIEI